MFRPIINVALAAFVMTIASAPVQAQQVCGEREAIIDRLKGKYEENHRASGLQNKSTMVEIWTSEKTGSWTILVTRTNGVSCIAATGKNWLDYAAEANLGPSS